MEEKREQILIQREERAVQSARNIMMETVHEVQSQMRAKGLTEDANVVRELWAIAEQAEATLTLLVTLILTLSQTLALILTLILTRFGHRRASRGDWDPLLASSTPVLPLRL